MKRLALSVVVSLCGVLMIPAAHASFAEKQFVDDPGWKTQDEVDAQEESRIDARTTMPSHRESTTDTEGDFNETDDGDDARFGERIRLDDLRLTGNGSITRAEFTALLVRSLYGEATIQHCYWDITSVFPPRFELLFRDVSIDHPHAPEICIAMRDGLVRGYGNDIFRPDAYITLADAAKIAARAHGLTPWADPSRPKHWFDTYIQALARRNAIPMSIDSIGSRLSVSDAREMLRRLSEDDRSQESHTADELIAAWERLYEPVRRPIVVSVPTRMSPPSSSGTKSDTGTMSSEQSADTTMSAPSQEESQSSRPKAWYEF